MWKWETDKQPKAVVAILHGAYEQHRWYAWLIERCRKQGMHVIMGDLPGHGETSRSSKVHDESFKSYDDYAQKLIQSAFSYELPVFVLGHGLGATIAIQAMRKNYKCAGIILTSPWLSLKFQPGKLTSALTGLGSLTANMKVTHEIQPYMLTSHAEVIEELKNEPFYNNVVSVKWYRDLQNLGTDLLIPEFNAFPDIPILLMTGQSDKIIDIAVAKKWLYRQPSTEMRYREWKHCAHNLFHEVERENIFVYMDEFIDSILQSLGYVVD